MHLGVKLMKYLYDLLKLPETKQVITIEALTLKFAVPRSTFGSRGIVARLPAPPPFPLLTVSTQCLVAVRTQQLDRPPRSDPPKRPLLSLLLVHLHIFEPNRFYEPLAPRT